MSVNNFGLFFTRDGQVVRLPVNPEKLPVARDHDNPSCRRASQNSGS